jgi:hypothetical protein
MQVTRVSPRSVDLTSTVVYALAALVVLVAVVLVAGSNLTAQPNPVNFQSDSAANVVVPGGRLFQVPTAPILFGDERLIDAPLPGADAALSAVYASSGTISIWDINAQTGQGTEVMRFTEANEVQLIGTGAISTLYALPDGTCQLNSFYPDGKSFEYPFTCLR